MRRIFITALIGLSLVASAEDGSLDFYALGVSHHFAPKDQGLNDVNPGLGFGVSQSWGAWDATVRVMVYEDSYRKQAQGIGIGARYWLGDRKALHATLELDIGDLNGSAHHGGVLLPIFGVGYSQLGVEATYSPSDEMVGAWLAWHHPIDNN